MKDIEVNLGTGPAPKIAAHYFYSVQFVLIDNGDLVSAIDGNFWTTDDIYVPDLVGAVTKMAKLEFNHPNYEIDQVACQILALNNITLPRHVMGMQQALVDDRRQTEIEVLESVSSEVMEVLRDKGNSKTLVPKLELMWASLKAKIATLRNGE